jgi:rhamnosyltransferase
MRFKTIFFSNSFGAYRKSALEQAGGFPKESNFGEDTVVAARLLQNGSEPWLVREFGNASGEGRRFVLSEIGYLLPRAPRLIPEAILRSGLKYLGYQRGRRNRQT